MDRFDTLLAFVRVVEAGSFTKAAQTLHMSKTTVSQGAATGSAAAGQAPSPHHAAGESNAGRRGLLRARGACWAIWKMPITASDGELAAPRGRCASMYQPVRPLHPDAGAAGLPALSGHSNRHGRQRPQYRRHRRNVDCVVRGGEITVPSLVASTLAI
jgi:hypothetical protein